MVYEVFTNGVRGVYERFTRCLRKVYEMFTKGVRGVNERFMRGLQEIQEEFNFIYNYVLTIFHSLFPGYEYVGSKDSQHVLLHWL
jgi:hypothetical protein